MTARFAPTGQGGGGGSAVGHFTFIQQEAARVWEVVHNLGFIPTVQVFDSAGDEVEGDVVHDSPDQFTATFSAPFGGVAYCN